MLRARNSESTVHMLHSVAHLRRGSKRRCSGRCSQTPFRMLGAMSGSGTSASPLRPAPPGPAPPRPGGIARIFNRVQMI